MQKHILHVEDELAIASMVKKHLRQSGFDVSHIDHGDQVITWVKQHKPDLILLDVTLPGRDGWVLCGEIRQFSNLPIIMLTDKVTEEERLLGLEMGADDYICRPFSVKEMVMRVKVVLRRFNQCQSCTPAGLFLNEDLYCVCVNNHQVALTAIEFNMIKLLVSKPNCIFSRTQIMNAMYTDFRINSERTVDSHILKLRKKLAALKLPKPPIRAVYGVGFKYEIAL